MADAYHQTDIYDTIADVDIDLKGYPVRVDAWQKRSRFFVDGHVAPEYTLTVDADGFEYTKIVLALPAGWSYNPVTGDLVTPGCRLIPCDKAVKDGAVKIAQVDPLPDLAATTSSRQRYEQRKGFRR